MNIALDFAFSAFLPLTFAAPESEPDEGSSSTLPSSGLTQQTIIIIVVVATVVLLATVLAIMIYCYRRAMGSGESDSETPKEAKVKVKKRREVHFPKTTSKLVQVTYISENEDSVSQSTSSSGMAGVEGWKKTSSKLSLLSKISSSSANGTVVWKAHFRGKHVACKRFNTTTEPGLDTFKLLADKFLAEATKMQVMKHERIVEFIDIEMETFSIITELMSCGRYLLILLFKSLKQYIKKHQFDCQWGKKHRMFVDVCEGMEYLHAVVDPESNPKTSVCHMDLKSSNVMLYKLDNSIRAKVSDFGLSGELIRELTSSAPSDPTEEVGTYRGAKYYMAPELYEPNPTFTKESDGL